MALEIERKFLVKDESWREHASRKLYCQGYLSRQQGRTIRVRRVEDKAFLTIKGKTTQRCLRKEFEYEIPLADGIELLDNLCEKPLIEKYRHLVSYGGMEWEIDEFLGDNYPLIVAEIELESVSQQFAKPQWLGEEVTHDPRYFNSSLVSHPYTDWK